MQEPRSPRRAAARLALPLISTRQKFLYAVAPSIFPLFLAFGLGWIVGINNPSQYHIPGGIALCGVAFLLVLLLLSVFNLAILSRAGAWLEGTTLVVCGLWTRHSDLAAAPVSLRRISGWLCLIARDNVTGREARLALSRLSATELAALADAIMAGGRQDPEARQVADDLRRQAAERQWADGQRRAELSGMSGPPVYPGYGGSGR
jgi:hypothetical protein